MTLGELKKELEGLGVKQVGALRKQVSGEERSSYTVVFSSDPKIVFPFALKTVYFLTLDSLEDSAKVNSEKYKALQRAIERDRKNGANA